MKFSISSVGCGKQRFGIETYFQGQVYTYIILDLINRECEVLSMHKCLRDRPNMYFHLKNLKHCMKKNDKMLFLRGFGV